jgi:hypothetical protein
VAGAGDSGIRIEPSWTEPPPFAWVFIDIGERAICRRRSGVATLSEPKRGGSIVNGCEEEHVAEGRAMVRPDKSR